MCGFGRNDSAPYRMTVPGSRGHGATRAFFQAKYSGNGTSIRDGTAKDP
jgi:hypothetical protein